MDDLRWILLLIGIAVLAAVYFSGRFDSEVWTRTRKRKQSRTGQLDKIGKKMSWKKKSPGQPAGTARTTIKKEPSIGTVEAEPITEQLDPHVPAQHVANDLPLKNVTKAKPVSPTIPHSSKTVTIEPATKTDQGMSPDHQIETAHAEYFGIEDEITEIEIPLDLAAAEAEIHITNPVSDTGSSAMPPDIEPLVLSVSVFTDDENENFNGPEIKEALEAEGLLHGTMRIFHFHAPDKNNVAESDDTVFSVASVLEPGFFDLEKLNEMQTPGLMLFCQLPGPLSGEDALEVMLDKGRGLAVRLHGHICDDKRNRFTTQAKNHYLDRIAAFNQKRMLARKKMPAN